MIYSLQVEKTIAKGTAIAVPFALAALMQPHN
jgi:hypothetical protein